MFQKDHTMRQRTRTLRDLLGMMVVLLGAVFLICAVGYGLGLWGPVLWVCDWGIQRNWLLPGVDRCGVLHIL
jgi:hypothetical protein